MIKNIFKYIFLFCGIVLFLFGIQNLVIRIPNKYINENLVDSLKYYEDVNDIDSIIKKKNFIGESLSIHYYSDCITLNMINNFDSNNPFKSQILMKYYTEYGNTICNNLNYSVLNDVKANKEYSRYWHGSITFIKPLLLFMNTHAIKILFCIILFSSIFYLIYLISRKSLILSLVSFVSLICCTCYVIPLCFEYFFAFLIAIIASIIVMKNLDKDNSFYYKLFFILGILACFFDFLTYEVLTIMLPLFLKVYFDNFKKDNIDFKQALIFIVKCSIFWLISYVMTFCLKWVLSAIVLGPRQFLDIWSNAKVRIYDITFNKFYAWIQSIIRIVSMIFPFSIFKNSPILFLIYMILILYLYIFQVPRERKKFLNLLFIISAIGILRLNVLFTHSWGHYFFDYRNLLPFIMWTLLIVYESVRGLKQ